MIEKKSDHSNYLKLLNGRATNALAIIPTSSRAIKTRFVYHPETSAGTLSTGDVKIIIKDLHDVTQLGNSILFLYYLISKFTQKTSYKQKDFSDDDLEIYFDVDEYLEEKGKDLTADNRKNTIRDIKNYYETLKKISIDFEEYDNRNKEIKRYSLEIFSGKGTSESLIKRSKSYFFILNPLLAKYLVEKNYITFFPRLAIRIDIMRHPNSLSLVNKLAVIYSLNFWNTNKGIISLTKLLPCISDIPSFEAVSKSNREYTKRIIQPLENELNYLSDMKILSKWEWCNSKNNPLSKEQMETFDFGTLRNCCLHYELSDYPEKEQLELRQKREERIKKRCKPNVQKCKPNVQKV